MALRIHPLAFAAGAAALWTLLRAKNAEAASNALGGPQPLYAGVPYLFIVRMPPADDDAEAEAQRESARAFLATKAATLVTFAPITLPPEFRPSGTLGSEIVSFRVVPAGNSIVQRGKPFYELGTLEKVTRLDGQPFARSPE